MASVPQPLDLLPAARDGADAGPTAAPPESSAAAGVRQRRSDQFFSGLTRQILASDLPGSRKRTLVEEIIQARGRREDWSLATAVVALAVVLLTVVALAAALAMSGTDAPHLLEWLGIGALGVLAGLVIFHALLDWRAR